MSDSLAEDDFIWASANDGKEFHRQWSSQAPPTLLRKIYPDHSIVLTPHNVLKLPQALFSPLPDAPLVTSVSFQPGARSNGEATGALVDQIQFGAFSAAWDGSKYDFIVYVITYPSGFGTATLFCILHQGPEDPARAFILKAGLWSDSLHDEIWVYNQGFWQKDHALWVDIQKADWKDVILKDDFKKALHKDVYGFFKSEGIYKELGIPWKRGLIMHGPPGNGKTISIKVIMKTCDALGFAPLYVKSFQNWAGEEAAMQQVFEKARQLSPCVIVLEDLDALINDRNRSFFLNQLDGLQGNDGLLVIGTTNHFDRLDPGLSTRPSRFDRKYLFDDPDRDERVLYVQYWQNKLKSNKEIDFPDALVDEVASQTEQFSFAYLKEAFVSSLVTLAGWEGDDKPTFSSAIKAQIKVLRKQLDKMESNTELQRDFRPLFDRLSTPFSVFPPSESSSQPEPSSGERDFRALLDRLQGPESTLESSELNTQPSSRERDFRVLLDRLQGPGSTPEFLAHLAETRRMLAVLPTPSAWDSSHTQMADASRKLD
ncbi:P-loop containing nucleoside triphosphate hydrolase protein [Mycena polygramma]|nr:P-loop containing nucleoside triphosphate hydrolase protein [Mycena polygramma]